MPQTSSPLLTLAPPQTWVWRGFPICYQAQGDRGAAIVLVHGFGASWQHWRQNIPVLAQYFRVYAIDLIGFGASAKPKPGDDMDYTFETWAQQLIDFCREVVVDAPIFLVGNSIGCVAAMQAAVAATNPSLAPSAHPNLSTNGVTDADAELIQGLVLINCSLRLLHDRYRSQMPWYRLIGVTILQGLLGRRWFGHNFFKLIAKPKTVRKILGQAYANPDAVTDELVNIIMKPAADPTAPDVFIAFTRYSQGPLPQDLLEKLTCPVLLLWGAEDPWESIDQGQQLAKFPCVQNFIRLDGAGHCPQDEVPEQVNVILQEWIVKQTGQEWM